VDKEMLDDFDYMRKHYGQDGVGWFVDEDINVMWDDNKVYFDGQEFEEFFFPIPIELTEEADMVNNPAHYTSHPSGVECIEVTRHMSFNLGNATKYIWRCDLKKDAIEDLRKAIFYLNDEIELRLKQQEDKQ
jgi:hypothetical protein